MITFSRCGPYRAPPGGKNDRCQIGSASPDIIRNSAETLAGRIGYLQLTPFTLRKVDDLQQLWLRGGFPLSYLAATDSASATWRRHFITTYIQRDLGLLGLQTDVQIMDRFGVCRRRPGETCSMQKALPGR